MHPNRHEKSARILAPWTLLGHNSLWNVATRNEEDHKIGTLTYGAQMLIVAFGLRLLLYSPKYVSEINQELDLKVETAKQRIMIVVTRRMSYNKMWDGSTKTVLRIVIASPLSRACMLQNHRP